MSIKFITRIAGSMLVASVVVYALLMLGVGVMARFEPEDDEPLKIHAVDLLEAFERKRWSEELGEDKRSLPERPQMAPLPAYEPPQREVNGFVQLEVSVGADGNVNNVEIIGAAPAGIYEEQAIQIIRNRQYSPNLVDGVAVPSTRSEVIDFTVPASDKVTVDQ